jgi:hypothetical protein
VKPEVRSRAARLGARVLSLVLVFSSATATTGCVDWDRIKQAFTSKKKSRTSKPTAGDTSTPEPGGASRPSTGVSSDLGVAAYPGDAQEPRVKHEWDSSGLVPKHYRLTFVMSKRADEGFEDKFRHYASSVTWSRLDGHKFKWVPPEGCERDLGCVFAELVEEERTAILPIADLFKERAKDAHLDPLQIAQLVVNFVQDIDYYEPDEEPFGMFGPAMVVGRSRGDCDSKSLLAHAILAELGIDSIMLSSTVHRHAMLGIALPVRGTKMVVEGRDYAFTELTAPGAAIGYLFPDNAKPNDWRPVLLRHPTRQGAPKLKK